MYWSKDSLVYFVCIIQKRICEKCVKFTNNFETEFNTLIYYKLIKI